MSGSWTYLRVILRDGRTLFLAGLVAQFVLQLGVELGFQAIGFGATEGEPTAPYWRALIGLIAFPSLLWAAQASEIAGPAPGSARALALAALPCSAARAAALRLLALLWVGVAQLATAALSYACVLGLLGREDAVVAMFASFASELSWLSLSAPVALTSFTVASLGVGGLGAVLLGLLLCVPPIAAWWWWTERHALEWVPAEALQLVLVLGASCALAALLVRTRARLEQGERLRAAAWALGSMALCLLPVGVVVGLRTAEWNDLSPEGPYATAYVDSISPDGRFAVLQVAHQEGRFAGGLWLVDLSDGRTTDFADRRTFRAGWTKEGQLALWRSAYGDAYSGEAEEFALVDPREPRVELPLGGGPLAMANEPQHAWARVQWVEGQALVSWVERGLTVALPPHDRFLPTAVPGQCVLQTDRGIELYDLELGRGDLLLDAEYSMSAGGLAPDGRHLWAMRRRALDRPDLVVVDVVERRIRQRIEDSALPWWDPRAGSALLFRNLSEGEVECRDLHSGETRRIQASVPFFARWGVASLPDGRTLVCQGRSLRIHGRDGRFQRQLALRSG